MTNHTVRTPSAQRLLIAGLVAAVVVRGALFLLSTGEFQPAFGSDQFGNGVASLILDVLVALILIGTTVTVAAMPDHRRAATFAHALGWVCIADCLIYGATTAAFYLTSTNTDAPPWFAAVPTVLQIPLVVLAILVIRITRRAGDPSPAASRSARSTPDPGGSPA
jgi:hypothetical protein